jgi:sugar lactone lactonase YvrE
MDETAFTVVIDGLYFGEGPRWHDDWLWFSDIKGHKVLRWRPGADLEQIAYIADDMPSGLGWLPDGRLLVVAVETRRLLRQEHSGAVVEHADLSGLCRGIANDMIVAANGTAYVDDSGLSSFDVSAERRPGRLLRVTPDGAVQVAAEDLEVPNGCLLSDDGRTLIVAEAHGGQLTAFDVEPDGGLARRRMFALPEPAPGRDRTHPDGICLDAEDAVWVADIRGRRLLRVREGGEIAESVSFASYMPIACVLGGPDRRTLFVCTVTDPGRRLGEVAGNVILAGQVEVPGAGRP